MSGPAMDITIRWTDGGEPTTVRSNLATAQSAQQIVRAGETLTLTSDPGEPLWLVQCAPGSIAGIVARLAEPEEHTVVVGRALLERAAVPLDMVREIFTGALEGQADAVLAALAQALPKLVEQRPDVLHDVVRLVDMLIGERQ